MNVIGNLEKEEVEEEGKKKQDSPLNPISPDEDYANDPEERSETASHSNFGEGSFN